MERLNLVLTIPHGSVIATSLGVDGLAHHLSPGSGRHFHGRAIFVDLALAEGAAAFSYPRGRGLAGCGRGHGAGAPGGRLRQADEDGALEQRLHDDSPRRVSESPPREDGRPGARHGSRGRDRPLRGGALQGEHGPRRGRQGHRRRRAVPARAPPLLDLRPARAPRPLQPDPDRVRLVRHAPPREGLPPGLLRRAADRPVRSWRPRAGTRTPARRSGRTRRRRRRRWRSRTS